MSAILAFIAGKPAKMSAIIALEELFQMARSAIFAAQPGIPIPGRARRSSRCFNPNP